MSTPGLFSMSAAFAAVKQQCKEWKWRALKAEGELEELRMRLHQVGTRDPQVKKEALNYLKAEAEDYHRKLQEFVF